MDEGARSRLAAAIYPDQRIRYFEVPSASNAVSNWIVRAAAAEAPWVQGLADLMEVGSRQEIYLVVGSADDGVARTAVSKALKRVKSARLEMLHLGLLNDVPRGEKLRKRIEATGAEFRVAPSKP